MIQQQNHYSAILIGGGLSGLTAASLLAKRGFRVAVVEKSDQPGGSCGIFRRGETTFDHGSAMRCHFCEHPACCGRDGADIPGILRRVAVGNIAGAKKCFAAHPVEEATLVKSEADCIRIGEGGSAVEISRVIRALTEGTL